MAVEVILPRVDMDMTEGKVALWHVRNGDTVSKGQVVFEMETDKATMEVEATADGVVQGIADGVGEPVPVGKVLAWILRAGESLPVEGEAAPVALKPLDFAASPASREQAAASAPLSAAGALGKLVRATPLARSIARQRGIELGAIQGSGQHGRIYAGDLAQADSSGLARADASDSLHLHWFARHGGTPLVLLHGFGADLGSWRPLAAELGDVSVLGIDLPNHGKSARIATRGFAELARRLVDRLDAEDVGAVHLLGHSLGGGAALAMAGLLKERLHSLTLLAPVGMGPEINGAFIHGLLRAGREESLRPWLAQLFGDTGFLSASFVATALQQLRPQEKRDALAAMADTFFPDGTQAELLRDCLIGLEMPLKLVWGTLDRVIPPHQSLGLPGSVALHTLPGVGHLPQVESADLLAALVRYQIAASKPGEL